MRRILPVLVISQFFCTSLWFAGNAVIADIVKQLDVSADYLGHLASAVQLGFISGTLIFGLLGIADRYSPSRVFFVSSLIAAAVNLGCVWPGNTATSLLALRFMTGFFLAGIYPVGMKIAADHYKEGLGKSLGFLVGALVLGTAFPHLLKGISAAWPWQQVLYGTSILAAAGGLAVLLFVPDGAPRNPGSGFRFSIFAKGFSKQFNAAALGYFGHMWELYAFWVFLPVMLASYRQRYGLINIDISLACFFIIAIGSIGCGAAGILSRVYGAKKVAAAALAISCTCCLLSPLFLLQGSVTVLVIFLLVWGCSVVADSPLFSTLVAGHAPANVRGTALTLVTCVGFSITIVSIQVINALIVPNNAPYIYMILAIGPVLGLVALLRK